MREDGNGEQARTSLNRNQLPQQLSTGNSDDIGRLLENFRPYLLAIAMAELPNALRGKVGASNVVQETILKGFENYHDFQGLTHEELAGWLRTILLNHLSSCERAYRSQKRDMTLEVPVNNQLPSTHQASPSGVFQAREQSAVLEDAISRLPAEYRNTILMRHRENMSFAEIGKRLQKSEEAVCKLWARAVKQLQQELQRHESFN